MSGYNDTDSLPLANAALPSGKKCRHETADRQERDGRYSTKPRALVQRLSCGSHQLATSGYKGNWTHAKTHGTLDFIGWNASG